MMKDAWRTNSWKEKCTLWFKPTGYRPADVAEKFPVYKIEDVYNFEKYDTRTSPLLKTWCWIQLIAILLFITLNSYLVFLLFIILPFTAWSYVLVKGQLDKPVTK